MYILIQNDGEVELAAFTLIGASTKEGQDKIGFFGSGNKYAIATLLRKNIPFHIFSGTKELVVETKDVVLRDQTYKQIWIDGQPTSLTTRMGPTWETWFALREFVCNAMDEGGYELDEAELARGYEGKTTIAIPLAGEVQQFFDHMEEYVVTDNLKVIDEVLTGYGTIRIIEKPDPADHMNFFRKGISICPRSEKKESLFWYDFSEITINESRVYVNDFNVSERIASALAKTTNRDVIQAILDKSAGHYEGNLYWEYSAGTMAKEWAEALRGKTVVHKSRADHFPAEDNTRHVMLQDSLVSKILNDLPEVPVAGSTMGEWTPSEGREEWLALLEQAKARLERIQINVTTPIELGYFADKSTLAMYSSKEDKISLSCDYIADTDETDLSITLMEEHYHSVGYADGSRRFELFLMTELFEAKETIARLEEERRNGV